VPGTTGSIRSEENAMQRRNREGTKLLSNVVHKNVCDGMSRVLIILVILLILVVPIYADQSSDQTTKGTTLLGQGRYSEAISAFDSALALNSNNLQARVGKGTALFSSGKPSESLLQFEIALSSNPSYTPALFERGRVLLATDNPKEALNTYNQALQLNPGSGQALEGKGDALFALGQGGDALTSWTEALSYDPGNSRLQGKIATAQESSGIPIILWIVIAVLIVIISSGLFWYLRSSRKGSPKGKKISPKGVPKKTDPNKKPVKKKEPTALPILLTRPGDKEGPASVKESHLSRIHRMMKKTGQKAGSLPGKNTPGTTHIGGMDNPGITGGIAGSPEESLPDIEMVESLNNSSSPDTITDITRSLDILLKSGDCIYSGDGLKGILLYSNKEYEAAIKEFDKEIENYPDVVCVSLLKVRALMHLGRFSEAFDTDRSVLKLAKDNYEAIVLAALLADQLGHLDFGLRACNRATSLRHNSPIIWALKGTILHKKCNYPEALSAFKQSLDMDPESGVVWKEYGDILSKAGLYPEAIGAFEKVLLLSGEDPEIRSRIRTCQENLNIRAPDKEKVTLSGIESEKQLKPDSHSVQSEMRHERTDTELTGLEFFPAVDQQNLTDWPGTGAHEQKS
jgi:tetratricopeptide (TPR) repeat protein